MGRSKSNPLSRRDRARQIISNFYQEIDTHPQVTEVEWRENGVHIGFDDGSSAVFSAALLYANLPDRKGSVPTQ
jgi:hypothetical protein